MSDDAVISRAFDGRPEGLTRDNVLDNILNTSLTNTALSGARLYWEYWGKGYFNAKGVSIPVAVSVFPDELYPAPKSWAEQAYPKLIHYNRLDKGGHFAAWEQPKLLSEEIYAGFRSLRPDAATPDVLLAKAARLLVRRQERFNGGGSPVFTPLKKLAAA